MEKSCGSSRGRSATSGRRYVAYGVYVYDTEDNSEEKTQERSLGAAAVSSLCSVVREGNALLKRVTKNVASTSEHLFCNKEDEWVKYEKPQDQEMSKEEQHKQIFKKVRPEYLESDEEHVMRLVRRFERIKRERQEQSQEDYDEEDENRVENIDRAVSRYIDSQLEELNKS